MLDDVMWNILGVNGYKGEIYSKKKIERIFNVTVLCEKTFKMNTCYGLNSLET